MIYTRKLLILLTCVLVYVNSGCGMEGGGNTAATKTGAGGFGECRLIVHQIRFEMNANEVEEYRNSQLSETDFFDLNTSMPGAFFNKQLRIKKLNRILGAAGVVHPEDVYLIVQRGLWHVVNEKPWMELDKLISYLKNQENEMVDDDLNNLPDIWIDPFEPCRIDTESSQFLEQAMTDLNFSARAHDRILKVARTLADLAAVDSIQTEHVLEAIQYRSLDRNLWA